MPNTTPTEEEENMDAVDSQSAAEDQFDDVVIEEVLIQTGTEDRELDKAVVGELPTQLGEADEDDVEQKCGQLETLRNKHLSCNKHSSLYNTNQNFYTRGSVSHA